MRGLSYSPRMLRLLMIGDIYAEPGLRAVRKLLPPLREQFDFVLANAENASGGRGVHDLALSSLFKLGVDCVTLGNHTWRHQDIYGWLEDPRVLRPLNYPEGTPGRGLASFQVGGERLAVASALGRVFMEPMDCPFQAMDLALKGQDLGTVVLDFHAEATSEKAAMAAFLDGRVGAVLGTHTHVATADERILPGGTAFQTDVGMTGVLDSVIGADPEAPVKNFRGRIPQRLKPAQGTAWLHATALSLQGGRAVAVSRISLSEEVAVVSAQ